MISIEWLAFPSGYVGCFVQDLPTSCHNFGLHFDLDLGRHARPPRAHAAADFVDGIQPGDLMLDCSGLGLRHTRVRDLHDQDKVVGLQKMTHYWLVDNAEIIN